MSCQLGSCTAIDNVSVVLGSRVGSHSSDGNHSVKTDSFSTIFQENYDTAAMDHSATYNYSGAMEVGKVQHRKSTFPNCKLELAGVDLTR